MPKTGISKPTRQRAKALRREPTDAEKTMWRAAREINRLRKTRFRRQAPIGPFIADFACFTTRLVIEIDRPSHVESVSEQRRDAWLSRQGFTILRFRNTEIFENREGVLATIDGAIAATPWSRDIHAQASSREERLP